MKLITGLYVLGLAAMACTGRTLVRQTPEATSPSEEKTALEATSPEPPSPKTPDARWREVKPPPEVERFPAEGTLQRLGTVTERQETLLKKNGFFLAKQPAPAADPDPDEARTARRATHLFHVYERNDYIRLPSYVTVDLAIDITHAYIDAVLRELEARELKPRLRGALRKLVKTNEAGRSAIRTAEGRALADRAITFWAVALRLLEQAAPGDSAAGEPVLEVEPYPSYDDDGNVVVRKKKDPEAGWPARTPLPKRIEATVKRTVDAVHAARGLQSVPGLKGKLDLSSMKPRGHYTQSVVLQRYFRCMSWLGSAAFLLEGEHEDAAGALALARSLDAAPEAARELEQVLSVTAFFAGDPDAPTLFAARGALTPRLSGVSADALTAAETVEGYRAQLLKLPLPRIASGLGEPVPQIRALGRRAFEDAVALRELSQIAWEAMRGPEGEAALKGMMGAAGAAAVLGSDLAREIVVGVVPKPRAAAAAEALGNGRKHLAALPAAKWRSDAYHRTLHALRPLLDPLKRSRLDRLEPRAWQRRALFAFAAGWAELRHDTILYGEPYGAECNVPEEVAVPCWVEPVPTLYGRLADMVRALERRLTEAGVDLACDMDDGNNYHIRPLKKKTKLVADLLDFLEETARLELQGKPLDDERRDRIMVIGGEVEWILTTLANTYELSERDYDMSLVADVFTWRPSEGAAEARVLEVGIGHPDLIYAYIPGPEGPVLARGAVMSYRELLTRSGERLTDEAWRRRVLEDAVPDPPTWMEALYAEPVTAVKLGKDERGRYRCSPMSGARLEI